MIASKSQGSGNLEPGEPHRVGSPVHIIRLTEASYIDSHEWHIEIVQALTVK